MAILGAGPVAISNLIEAGLVSQVSDLYRLTWDDLVSLSGWGEKKTENLLEQITASKDRPLEKLLAALGIREVGRSASETLVGHYHTLFALLEATADEDGIAATYNQIRQLDGFGPKMAESFCSYMGNPNNRKQLYELLKLGVAVGTEKQEAGDTEVNESTAPETLPTRWDESMRHRQAPTLHQGQHQLNHHCAWRHGAELGDEGDGPAYRGREGWKQAGEGAEPWNPRCHRG